ncbi:hypothetical protein IH824_12190 [candidate division KSB1 bacterium]|nr:hypothetical protein [candidate division KSB1 bacterium]
MGDFINFIPAFVAAFGYFLNENIVNVPGELFERYGRSNYYDIALEVERVGTSLLSQKRVYPNVDFYSGIVYEKLGIDTDLFTPVFAMARVAGWLAHWIEQLKDNHVFRPTEIYGGSHNVPYVPLDQRP